MSKRILQHTSPITGDVIVFDDMTVTIDGVASAKAVVTVENGAVCVSLNGDGVIDINPPGEAIEPEQPTPEPTPTKMTPLAFMDLVGDQNMVTLLTLAKTDPVAELLVKKIDRADVIDFADEIRGPKKGLMYLVSVGKISQEDFDRIMRREFLA